MIDQFTEVPQEVLEKTAVFIADRCLGDDWRNNYESIDHVISELWEIPLKSPVIGTETSDGWMWLSTVNHGGGRTTMVMMWDDEVWTVVDTFDLTVNIIPKTGDFIHYSMED